MPHIDLFGSHPREFLTCLEAAGYTSAEHAAYATYNLLHDQPPAAVAVHGSDAALESPEAIAQLLKTETILLLFAPSPALLNAVKSATRSPFELTKFELANGNAFIVHKMHGLDRYHFIPGAFLGPRRDSEDTSNTPVPSESDLLQASVNLIGEAISYASNPEVLRELAPLNDTFLPPPRTNYCYNTIITIPGGLSERWTLNIYIYVANVHPADPDFKAKGGRVYTLIKHSGNFRRLNNNDSIAFIVEGMSGGVHVHVHRPQGYERKDGDDYIYKIDYTETYNLFTDLGENLFQHRATYLEPDFRLVKTEQFPFSSTINLDGFTYKFYDDSPSGTGPIYALSVFVSDLEYTELGLLCSWAASRDFGFDPRTFT